MTSNENSVLLIVSGPAGSGKGTVVNYLRKMLPDLGYSVSATTRTIRPGEVDGVNYHFISKELFEEKIQNGDILEYNKYCDNYYGTLKEEVANQLNQGKDVLLEIDIHGGENVKKAFPNNTVTVMLVPPDFDTLKQRLTARGTETPDVIEKRLQKAQSELEYAQKNYDYIVTNEDFQIEDCAKKLEAIIKAEHYKVSKMNALFNNFFENK